MRSGRLSRHGIHDACLAPDGVTCSSRRCAPGGTRCRTPRTRTRCIPGDRQAAALRGAILGERRHQHVASRSNGSPRLWTARPIGRTTQDEAAGVPDVRGADLQRASSASWNIKTVRRQQMLEALRDAPPCRVRTPIQLARVEHVQRRVTCPEQWSRARADLWSGTRSRRPSTWPRSRRTRSRKPSIDRAPDLDESAFPVERSAA